MSDAYSDAYRHIVRQRQEERAENGLNKPGTSVVQSESDSLPTVEVGEVPTFGVAGE